MQWPQNAEEFGGWVLAGLAAVGAAWKLRKQQSNDSLAIKENDSKGGWITRLERDRDSAVARERETWAMHLKDAQAIAALTMKNAFMQEKVERLEHEMALIKRLLVVARPDLADLMSNGFVDLVKDGVVPDRRKNERKEDT